MQTHTLTDASIHMLLDEALSHDDFDLFYAECATSTLLIDPDDPAEPDWERIADILQQIWRAAHVTVKDIRTARSMTQKAFADRYHIAFRTLQRWEADGTCPLYARLLLAKDAGMLDFADK